jgi:hypothetical protein
MKRQRQDRHILPLLIPLPFSAFFVEVVNLSLVDLHVCAQSLFHVNVPLRPVATHRNGRTLRAQFVVGLGSSSNPTSAENTSISKGRNKLHEKQVRSHLSFCKK